MTHLQQCINQLTVSYSSFLLHTWYLHKIYQTERVHTDTTQTPHIVPICDYY